MKTINNMHDKYRSERGQSMTEFALSVVILLTLLAGVVDFGRAFYAHIIIRDAAQEGAVYGSIAPKTDISAFTNQVADRVETAFTNPSDPTNLPIDITQMIVQTNIIGSPCAAPGNGVRVKVDYSMPVTMPFLGAVIGSQDIKLSTTVENAILSPICP
jgi:Flp pilus assembly protein TadG